MIDVSAIRTNIRFGREVIEETAKFAVSHNLPDLTVAKKYRQRDGSNYYIIDVLPNGALQLHVKVITSTYFVLTKIKFNGPKLLYGHNGITIRTNRQLQVILARVFDIVSRFVSLEDCKHIIPGLYEESLAMWSYLEFAWQFRDPNGALELGCRNMHTPLVRKPTFLCPGESAASKGKKLKISGYDKGIEMRSRQKRKVGAIYGQAFRLEVGLNGEKIAEYLGSDEFGFSIEDLRNAYLKVMGTVKGVYHQSTYKGGCGVSRFIARVSKESAVRLANVDSDEPTVPYFSVEYLCELYRHEKGIKPDQVREIRKHALRHLEAMSTVSAAGLFSDANFHDQPRVRVPILEEKVAWVGYEYRNVPSEIECAYGGDTAGGPWRPDADYSLVTDLPPVEVDACDLEPALA